MKLLDYTCLYCVLVHIGVNYQGITQLPCFAVEIVFYCSVTRIEEFLLPQIFLYNICDHEK